MVFGFSSFVSVGPVEQHPQNVKTTPQNAAAIQIRFRFIRSPLFAVHSLCRRRGTGRTRIHSAPEKEYIRKAVSSNGPAVSGEEKNEASLFSPAVFSG